MWCMTRKALILCVVFTFKPKLFTFPGHSGACISSLHARFQKLSTHHKDGVWVSYTSSLPVRKALKELGFSLSTTKSVGRKRGGTKAYFGGMVGKEEKEDSSERQWEGSGV